MSQDSGPSITPDEIYAIVRTRDGPIPLSDFSEFFQLFRTAYSAALESMIASGVSQQGAFADTTMRLVALTRNHLDNLPRGEIKRIGVRPLPVEPSIIRIHRDNPIEIVFSGLAILLCIAVVISGGKFEMSGEVLKIELPPLGEGIAKLREAFKHPGRRG